MKCSIKCREVERSGELYLLWKTAMSEDIAANLALGKSHIDAGGEQVTRPSPGFRPEPSINLQWEYYYFSLGDLSAERGWGLRLHRDRDGWKERGSSSRRRTCGHRQLKLTSNCHSDILPHLPLCAAQEDTSSDHIWDQSTWQAASKYSM